VATVAKRYAVAALAFGAAAIWFGLGLIHGFVCLFAFVLALQAVRLYQRRGDRRGRRTGSRRERPSRYEAASTMERDVSPRSGRGSDRPLSPGRVYDGDREEPAWPLSREATW
jgi:hypothetical protein